MTVYHGSAGKVKKPNISFSKNYLDFGKGFYTTAFKPQAEKWALRKADRTQNGVATVNVFELADNLSAYKVLTFESEDGDWLDFVL